MQPHFFPYLWDACRCFRIKWSCVCRSHFTPCLYDLPSHAISGAEEQQQQQEIAAETVAMNTQVPGDDDVPESRGQEALADEAARHEDTSATPQTELDDEKQEEELHERYVLCGNTL